MRWIVSLFGDRAADAMSEAPRRPTESAQMSSAHLLLISKFVPFGNPSQVAQPYWDSVLGESAAEAIQRFRADSSLIELDLAARLGRALRVDQLKQRLRERGLSLSGRKADLVLRLIEADREAMVRETEAFDLLTCSPAMQERVEQYKNGERARRATAEALSFERLRAGDIDASIETVFAFESTQVFRRGMGFEWSSSWERDYFRTLVLAVLVARPSILRNLPEPEWKAFGVAAAMSELWGQNTAEKWLPAGLLGTPRFDRATTIHMILASAHHHRNLEEIRGQADIGVDRVRIADADDCCERCKELAEIVYSTDAVPELPNAACIRTYGCRCRIDPVFDDE